MKTALVGLLYVGLALASPIVVRESRSLYGQGLVAPRLVGPAVVAPTLVPAPSSAGSLATGPVSPAHYLAAGFLSSQAIVANVLAALQGPSPVPVAPVAEPDYDEGYDGSADYAEAGVVPATPAPALYGGPGEVLSAATFPALDAPASTPAPALAGPTLDGPVVPPLVIKGPSGTIRSGALSTGAVSLAGHVSGH